MELGSQALVGNWPRGKRASFPLRQEGREKASLRLVEASKELMELPSDDLMISIFSMKQEVRGLLEHSKEEKS